MHAEERPHQKAEYQRWKAELSAILFRHDPVGLNVEENTDEYDAEAETILPRLRRCDDAADVRHVLHEEFSRWFTPGIADRIPDTAGLAQEVWTWWRSVSATRPGSGAA